MATNNQPPKDQYDAFASDYAKMEDLPGEMLTAQFLSRILRRVDVRGKRILDIGGGSGTYARLAVDLGAAHVAVVDVSAGMTKVGSNLESEIRPGSRRKIEYYVADCAKPLADAGVELPKESFDVVMANWALCYNDSVDGLKGMWNNIVAYLKPGGQYLGTLDMHARAKSGQSGKYGITHTILEEKENGARVEIKAATKPEIKFGSYLLEPTTVYQSVPESMGMRNVKFEHATEEDLWEGQSKEYWQDFLDDPYFAICTATKATIDRIYSQSV